VVSTATTLHSRGSGDAQPSIPDCRVCLPRSPPRAGFGTGVVRCVPGRMAREVGRKTGAAARGGGSVAAAHKEERKQRATKKERPPPPFLLEMNERGVRGSFVRGGYFLVCREKMRGGRKKAD